MTSPRGARRALVSLAAAGLFALASCDRPGEASRPDATPSPPTSRATGGTAPKPSCDLDKVQLRQPGTLTVATDVPGSPPWMGEEPSSGEGFEGELTYELAERLGFDRDAVTWIDVPYWDAFARGEKPFDVFIGRVLVLPERETEADLSPGYYRVDQAIVVRAGSPAARARTVADLQPYRFGGLAGKTGLTVIDLLIGPADRPYAYPGLDTARQALDSGEVEGLVLDHFTAAYLVSIDPRATLLGRVVTGDEFALAMPSGSRLVPCAAEAIRSLREDGTLRKLEREWLPSRRTMPVLPLG